MNEDLKRMIPFSFSMRIRLTPRPRETMTNQPYRWFKKMDRPYGSGRATVLIFCCVPGTLLSNCSTYGIQPILHQIYPLSLRRKGRDLTCKTGTASGMENQKPFSKTVSTTCIFSSGLCVI